MERVVKIPPKSHQLPKSDRRETPAEFRWAEKLREAARSVPALWLTGNRFHAEDKPGELVMRGEPRGGKVRNVPTARLRVLRAGSTA